MQNYNIYEIEKMTEETVKAIALETMNIKGHQVYFVDLGQAFGYSALVFLNGGHLYHANDYELHHSSMNREELRAWYVEGMNNKLFTEAEICGPVTNYDEAERKRSYIQNYYGMQRPYISIFQIFTGEEGKKQEAEYKRKTAKMIFSPVFFAYYDPADKFLVDNGARLMKALEESKKALSDNFDYWKGAFKSEMFNHEYGYAQDDFEVLSVFGALVYEAGDYFDQLGFSEVQKKAYLAARREVLSAEWD